MSLLGWAILFLIVAFVAAILGFTNVAVATAGIAKILFAIFLVVFLVLLVLNFLGACGEAVAACPIPPLL